MDLLALGDAYKTCESLPAGANETITERYLKSPTVDLEKPAAAEARKTAYRIAQQLGYETDELVFGMFQADSFYIISFYPKPKDPPRTGGDLTVVISQDGATVCIVRGA